MGIFLSSIEQEIVKFHKSSNHFMIQPFGKIEQYHGIFKSVCDNFSIQRDKFQQIFKVNEPFDQWNTQKTNKIDGLQLFVGLTCFSTDVNFKGKLRFLFDLFDFNELKSISLVDLEYLIVCICNSTFKMLKINAKINSNEIVELIRKKFKKPKQRVNITQLYIFCREVYQAKRYFQLVNTPIQDLPAKQKTHKFSRFCQPPAEKHLLQQLQQQQVQWYNKISKQIHYPQKHNTLSVKCEQEWVFGIRINMSRPFLVLPQQEIVYVSGKLAIIYSILLNQQRIYGSHKHQVCCVAYTRNYNMVATAQNCCFPSIHLWDSVNMQTKHILKTHHQNGIYLMEFISNQQKLVTVGARDHPSILIFCIKTYQLTHSILVPTFLLTLRNVLCKTDDIELQEKSLNEFVGCSQQAVYLFTIKNNLISYTELMNPQKYTITCCTAALLNLNNPYLNSYHRKSDYSTIILIGTGDGSIFLYADFNWKSLINFDTAITQIEFAEENILISTNTSIFIHCFEILNEEFEKGVELNIEKKIQSISFKILYFQVTASNGFLLITQQGQIVEILTNQISFVDEDFTEKYVFRKINSIINFSRNLAAMCILQRYQNNDRILFCAPGNERILSISLASHQLIDVWTLPDIIKAMHSISLDQGLTIIVLGSQSGRVYIRIDWQQFPRYFDCNSEVCQIKLAWDCSSLCVCTIDNHLFVFTNSNNNFVLQTPKKLHFENQCPIGVDYLDDSKSFVVYTNYRNVYQFFLPDLKHKNILKQNDKIYASLLNPVFSYKVNKEQTILLPGIIGGNANIFLLSDQYGTLKVYKDLRDLELNCHMRLPVHNDIASKIISFRDQKGFATMGKHDGTVIIWKMHALQLNSNKQQLHLNSKLIKRTTDKSIRSKDEQIFKTKSNIKPLSKMVSPSKLIDQFVLFKGIANPIISESLSRGIVTISEELVDKRPPNVSLQLQAVFGLQSNCIAACYDKKQKNIVYYLANRFLIKINSETKQQLIIQSIRNKISCLAMSKDNVLAIANQERNHATISIIKQGIIDKTLQTSHLRAVKHMSFYEELLFSYGENSPANTINIHNHKTGQLINCRSAKQPIDRFIIIDPNYFISCNQVRIWKSFYPSDIFMQATAGDLIQLTQDVCLGNSDGELFLVSQTKLHRLFKAHNKQVNFIKYVAISSNDFNLISAGDQSIRIFNRTFVEIKSFTLRLDRILTHLDDQNIPLMPKNAVSVSCLDIKDKNLLVLLNIGQLMEILLQSVQQKRLSTQQFQSQNYISETLMDRADETQFDLKTNIICLSHCGKKVSFSLHHYEPIIATVGHDSQLLVRNYVFNTIIGRFHFISKKLNCVKFGNKDNLLAIGFTDGEIKIYSFTTKFVFQLSLIQSFRDVASAVIGLQFSADNKYLVASFMPTTQKKSADFQENMKSLIIIYKNKQLNHDINENHFYPYDQIWERLSESYKTFQSKLFIAVALFKFINQNSLLLYYQYITEECLRANLTQGSEYRLYKIQQKLLMKEQQINIDWMNATFPNSIHARDLKQHKELMMTAMIIDQNFIFYGANSGNVHISKRSSLHNTKPLKELKDTEMCLGKSYASHVSTITQMAVDFHKKYLFVSAVSDDVITMFKIHNQSLESDLDFKDYEMNMEDLLSEVPGKHKFYNQINNLIPLRQEITDILTNIQDDPNPRLRLKEASFNGRRAADRRNNLVLDQIGQIIYTLGPNIMIHDMNTHKQRYISCSPAENSFCPQISTFTASGHLLAIATEEEQANLLVWEINSQVCLSVIETQLTIVLNMCFSNCSKYLFVIGLKQSYYSVIKLIDWKSKTVLNQASLLYTAVWKIKDICAYGNQVAMVSCGVSHLVLWKREGQILTYKNFRIDQAQPTTFLVCVSKEDLVYSGCDKGYIYQWNDLQLLNKISIGSPIKVMKLYGQNCLVVGSPNGVLTIVSVDEGQDHFVVRQSIQLDQNNNPLRHDIQSISVMGVKLIVGTRSGDIYELVEQKQLRNIITSHDNQATVSICFDQKSRYIYEITESGTVQLWDLKSLTNIYTEHFSKKAVKIFDFRDMALILFEKDIEMLNIQNHAHIFEQQMHIQMDSTIYDAKLTSDRNLLVIAVNLKDKQQLVLMDTRHKPFKTIYIFSLQFEVEYLDFSIDDLYLMFKYKHQDIGIIELTNFKRINTLFIQMDLQYQSEGIRLEEKAIVVHMAYGQQNNITHIARIDNTHIIVSDEMGTLRIFQYPCKPGRLGEQHQKCYTQHMNYINTLEVSPDRSWLASSSLMDRSLIIWRIIRD